MLEHVADIEDGHAETTQENHPSNQHLFRICVVLDQCPNLCIAAFEENVFQLHVPNTSVSFADTSRFPTMLFFDNSLQHIKKDILDRVVGCFSVVHLCI